MLIFENIFGQFFFLSCKLFFFIPKKLPLFSSFVCRKFRYTNLFVSRNRICIINCPRGREWRKRTWHVFRIHKLHFRTYSVHCVTRSLVFFRHIVVFSFLFSLSLTTKQAKSQCLSQWQEIGMLRFQKKTRTRHISDRMYVRTYCVFGCVETQLWNWIHLNARCCRPTFWQSPNKIFVFFCSFIYSFRTWCVKYFKSIRYVRNARSLNVLITQIFAFNVIVDSLQREFNSESEQKKKWIKKIKLKKNGTCLWLNFFPRLLRTKKSWIKFLPNSLNMRSKTEQSREKVI